MGKLAPALTALALTAALTACGSEAAPAPTPTPTITATPTPSPSPTANPSPTPPVMPDGAKAHTKAGAEAFVVYYWQAVDYAQQTLDTSLLEGLTNEACEACHRGIDSLKDDARRGAALTGGLSSLSKLQVLMISNDDVDVAEVEFTLTTTDQVEKFADGKIKRYPAGRVRNRMWLEWQGNRWTASQLEAVK